MNFFDGPQGAEISLGGRPLAPLGTAPAFRVLNPVANAAHVEKSDSINIPTSSRSSSALNK